MIDIRQLRYFQAVAEELHFGRASSRLRIAQPALSRQVQQLEDEIGTQLLKRTQRVVELTPAGELFLERTSQILDDLGSAISDARRVSKGEYGQLVVGFIHSSTYGLLPAIVERFRHLYPDIELELREMGIAEQHDALSRSLIDIGLLRPQPAPPGIEVQAIMEDPFLLAVPDKHHLAKREAVEMKSLAAEPMIMFSKRESPMFHSRITAMFEKSGFTLKIVQHATQIHTIVGLVGAGIGIAVVPETARNLYPRGVRFLQILDEPEPVHVALGWQRGKDTPAIRSFRQVALLVVQQMQTSRMRNLPD